MPNRFIDTEFFKRPFVRGLDAPLKTLYAFIICDCDNSGIWSPDFEIASIYIGQKVERKSVEIAFKNKIIELKNGQWFFPDFIEHQYPKGLQDTNPAHNKIIKRLTQLKLIDQELKVLARPSHGSKVKVKVMVEEEVKGIVKGNGVEPLTHALQTFISVNYPRVASTRNFATQLTFDEAEKLTALHSKELIKKKLTALENKKKLDYISVYETLLSWCKNDFGKSEVSSGNPADNMPGTIKLKSE